MVSRTTVKMLSALAVLVLLLACHQSQSQHINTPDEIEAYLIFSSLFRIFRFNVDVTDSRLLQNNAGDIVALDFDYQAGLYYWSDQWDKNIYRAPLEGGPAELVTFTGDSSQVDGIAVDWINNRLYWTDLPSGTIKRLDLAGFTNEVVLIATGVINPRGIVLDPLNDMMYFTDVNLFQPSIQRARMGNGTQQAVIVSDNLSKPNAITMDYDTDRLYFADATTNRIESCNLDGLDRTVVISGRNFNPFDLTLYDDRIYWTDLDQHHIVSAHKVEGDDRIGITGPFIFPYVIHAVHPSRQLTEEPRFCDANDGRGLCESNCTSFSTGYVCGCQDGFLLNDDLHTCSDLNECAFDNGGCSHKCSNLEGGFDCECIEGFILLPDGITCADDNECKDNRGGCEYACHNTDSGYYCSCGHGYELQANGRGCQDINECQAAVPPCPAEAQCTNREGAYACVCPVGFVYEPINKTCLDVDECLAGLSTCSQRCDNRPGTFSCSCHEGFLLDEEDGITCSDIDECQASRHNCQQDCVNIIGSYVCLCNEGFQPEEDGHSCAPIDCGRVDDVPGFALTCTGTSYGNTCSLSCIHGTLTGVSTVICQMNGLWSVSTAECISTEDTDGVNDPPHAIVPSSFLVPEDAGSGVTLGTLHTVDSDNHESYNYTLTSDPSGKFYIDGAAGNTLKTHGGFDYETSPTYTIQVNTADTGDPPLSSTFDLTISILDVNEPPSEPTLSAGTVGEHVAVGSLVGTVVASDPDQGQEETFSLVSSGGGKFNLQRDQLLVAGPLNFEEADAYTVVVLVEDTGTPMRSNIGTFSIVVRDENDPPTAIQLSGSEVPEVSPDSATAAGTIIGTLTTSDEDSGDAHAYSLGGPHSGCFSVVNSDLAVRDAACFDHETNPSLSLTVTSRDAAGLSVQQTFAVTVTDVGEAPSAITLSSSIIQEHVAVDTIVGTLTVIDPDQGDSHQLTIGTGGSLFTVQGTALVVGADLSFPDYPSGVAVAVEATDAAGHTYMETFTIVVQDVNEPPNALTWEILEMCSRVDETINGLDIHACVTENTAENTRVAVAMASDPDSDTLTLDLIDSGDIFKLDQNGALKVGNRGLNFESPLVGQVHSVTVVAEDPEGLTVTSQLNIKIINDNDPPSSVEISNTFVGASTATGQAAAVLRCIDEDVGDSHTFRLTDSAGGKFIIDDDQLKVNQDLSSLAGNEYSIAVQCSDGSAELPAPVTLILSIFEDGPIPPDGTDITIRLSGSAVTEQQPADTLVGILSVVTSLTQPFTFTIVGGASQLFSVQQGEADGPATLRTNQPLDYEEAAVHYVIVRAETGDESAVTTFEITVRNINEAPGNLMFHHSSVHENQEGALVGIVSASDPEGDSIQFVILADPSSAFQLQAGAVSNTRRLVTRRPLDFETEPSLIVGLVARDPSVGSLISEPATFTVTVLNVNEPPTAIGLDPTVTDENRGRGAVVGALTVEDPDNAHTHQVFTCSLLDSASGLFQLDGLNVEVFQGARLDYESFAASGVMPSITVECSDAGSLSVRQHFTITVSNVAERPTDIQSATGVFQVAENNEAGAVIAHLVTSDPDTDDQETFQYEVSDSGRFAVIGQMLITHVQMNYESQNRFDIEITSTDEDGLAYTKSVAVNVMDENDPPTAIIMSQTATLSAQSPTGTVIATLAAVDEDAGQRHEFRIQTQTPVGALRIADGDRLAVDAGSQREPSVQVTIVVQDVGVVTPHLYVQTFTIAADVGNLPPTALRLTGASVLEGSAVGTVVGEVQADDPTESDQLFCTLLDDAGGRFDLERVRGQILLQVADPDGLDFETGQSHSVRISCRDALPENTIEATFDIGVLDGPERPIGIVFTNAADTDTTTSAHPPDLSDLQGEVITLATATVREDAQQGVVIVAYVTVIAANGSPTPGQASPQLELITENEYNRLNRLGRRRRRDARRLYARTRRSAVTDPSSVPTQFVIPDSGQYILVGDAIDYETQGEYMLYVKATDRDYTNLVVTAQLRVVVLDVDEAPLDMTLSPITVSENAQADTQVGLLSVTDPDGTRSAYAYTIISHGTPFYVQRNRVLVQRPLDHETAPLVTIQVRVKEVSTDLQLVQNFDISVTDAPEPPTGLTVDGNTTVTVPETLTVDATVGTFVVTDPDSFGGFRFSFFLPEDSHGFFAIDAGRLVLARRLDAWTANQLSLFVQVTDPTGLSFRQVITLRVTSDDRCSRPGYCSPYATCLRGFCSCKPGFTGDGFTCSDIDECSPYPCHIVHSLNDQCANGFGGIRNFTCQCLPGWTARDCTVEVDSCQEHRCNPVGTVKCENVANSATYRCECRRGFEGPQCDGNTDECVQHQCQNGAECVDGIGLYTCDCQHPYEGYFCDLDPSLCDGVACPHHGVCNPLPDGTYSCRCRDPFLLDCSGCAFGYGGEDCQPCQPPFTGANCEIDSSVCEPNPCSYGGVCIPGVDKYSCVCPESLAIEGCRPLVVTLGAKGGPTEPSDTDDRAFPIWIVLVCASVLILAVIVVPLVCLAYRRHRQMPYKASSSFIPRRARFLSETEEVIIMPDHDILSHDYPSPDHPSRDQPSEDYPLWDQPSRDYPSPDQLSPDQLLRDQPSQDYPPRDYPSQDQPSQDYPSRDYPSQNLPERDYPMDKEPQPPPQSRPAVASPAEQSPGTDPPPEDNPPPYSPPDNLFLASALGLLPPGYEAKGPMVDLGGDEAPEEKKKEKLDSEGDRAVAQLMETMATPIRDRGTLQAKGSRLDDWEQAQLGLVLESKPQEEERKNRKKSGGRRPSRTGERRLSVGAVAYQNPIFIPENKVLSQQAAVAMQQHRDLSPSSFPGQGTHRAPASGNEGSRPAAAGGMTGGTSSIAQTGLHEDILADRRRSHRTSITKSPEDVTKQNPVFLESDNEDAEDPVFNSPDWE